MKISDGIQNVLVKKLSEALRLDLSLAHFNEAFLYLDKCNSSLKIVPYGVFENEEYMKMLERTDAGVIFSLWLEKTTGNISTDFNKGRKLVRIFKDIVETNDKSLAYNLSANNLFTVSLTSLFLSSSEVITPIDYTPEDILRLDRTLQILRNYLASIFYIDLISDEEAVENLISLFINGDLKNLIDDVIKQGVYFTIESVI